ncbi:polysaccharide deacetylase family protein [Oxynema sp. CENA135]|uniref:polysaccharide deacetylase family protein n=1 Tax=Oxynema sp. CENA135 TaxID=984206 RepID=UPI00190E37A4|nr:polysaccharide deacetylase family protein [Oxynema sp. CENA135]MBK4728682.1 polysaccharide deacetylase family protein [Oxynema sp. CENA135]
MQFAPLYPILYRVLKPCFPGCLWSAPTERTATDRSSGVALTFDDGPHPEYTPALLDLLDSLAVPATFFCLGRSVSRHPQWVRAIDAGGHGLGLHGYEHRSFPSLGRDRLQESLARTRSAIAHACGWDLEQVARRVRDVRPPNGVFTPQVLRWLREWNYRPVMWSVVPEDWCEPGVSVVVERVLAQVTDGSVIVLHDGYYGGRDVVATVAALVPQLRDRGYQFCLIEEFWSRWESTRDRRT